MIIINHALERCVERGSSEDEIELVLQKGVSAPAREGRKAKELVFDFNKNWHGKHYPEKKVKIVYIEENDEIVVLTVYVYYGKWR